MATRTKRLLTFLFCVAVGAGSEGSCADQREQTAQLQAELRALYHRVWQLTAAVPHARVRRAASEGDACSRESLVLTSDEEMEALRGCRTAGSLTIHGGSVTSLAALQSLETAREINIIGSASPPNDTITSLAGLENLRSVGAGLSISDNSNLVSLAGLESLQRAGSITIQRNVKVRSMAGLENLRSVEKRLTIDRNSRLQSLVGLENLANVGENLTIEGNRLGSILALQRLQSVININISAEQKLETLAGLDNITSVGTLLLRDTSLRSLSGLEGLQTAHFIESRSNEQLKSVHGLRNLRRVEDGLLFGGNSLLRSLSGLESLQTVARLWILSSGVETLAGLERLTSLRLLFLFWNYQLLSLSGLEGLQTAGEVYLEKNLLLTSLRGLGNLTVVSGEIVLKAHHKLRTLEGLERLRSTGSLQIDGWNWELTSLYPGLQNLEEAFGGVYITHCKLSSLHGLGSLRIARVVRVWGGRDGPCKQVVPMQCLGGPFAAGASVQLEIDGRVWPKCVTQLEHKALLSAVGELTRSSIPAPRCETRELLGTVTCTKGQLCQFSVFNSSIGSGEEQSFGQSIHVPGLGAGCGVCPQNHMQRKVDDNGLLDFGYALGSEEPGLRPLCSCNGSDPQGPVGELFLRGPRANDGVTVCTRGHPCTVKLEGEALQRTDRVVLTSGSCSEGNLGSGFAASWSAKNEYLLHSASGWRSAPPTRYQVCWRAPCSLGRDEPVCLAPESIYLHVGNVELFGSYQTDFAVVLGGNLSAANVGLGVSEGDRMRLMRTCGEVNEGGIEVLEALSFNEWFHFGALTANRVGAGRHHLCWCQERQGDNAVECKEARNFMADSGVVQILCPAGQKLNNGSGRCEACPAGTLQPQATMDESCSECPVGHFSLRGASECTACQDGTVAEAAGRSSCTSCRSWESSVEATVCSPDPEMVLLLASFPFTTGALCWILVRSLKKRLSVADVSLREDRTLVTIVGSHGLSNFSRSPFPVTFSGTGHPGLDKPSQPLLARVKDAARLELFTAQGSVRSRLDTSMGALMVVFPHDLYHQRWLLPAIICLPGLVLLVVALGILVASAGMAAEGFAAAAAAALVCTAASLALRFRPPATPLRLHLSEFKKGLLAMHRPVGCSKGPDRAISIGQLHHVLESFHQFIRDRTAYFLTSNLLVPLTKEERLSYAELVGPGEVQWFVSHFWGTAFVHFCASLRKHAETVSVGDQWAQVRYWVCFCSNNQHSIKEELGSGWQESSFYMTLRSGCCQGTCMVLDDEALPLTRIWCIFELLQTVKLQRSDEHFQGLLFCTSGGVLNTGGGSVEVAMALAQKVADMDLATAQATSESDADMIRLQVINEMGSFDALNRFTRQEVYKMLAKAQRGVNQRFAGVLAHLEENVENDGVAAV